MQDPLWLAKILVKILSHACDKEEGDTRIALHVYNIVNKGGRYILLILSLAYSPTSMLIIIFGLHLGKKA